MPCARDQVHFRVSLCGFLHPQAVFGRDETVFCSVNEQDRNPVARQAVDWAHLLIAVSEAELREYGCDIRHKSRQVALLQPALQDGGVNLELDCTELTYMASSGLRIIQKTMRTVMQLKGQFKITNVSPEIYKVLAMTGFTKFMKVEMRKDK